MQRPTLASVSHNDQIVEIEGTVPFRISLDFSRMVLNDAPAVLGQHSRRAETPSPDPSAYLTAPSTPNRRHEDEPVVTKTKAPQQHRTPPGSTELPPTPTSTVDAKRKPVDPARGQASRSRNTSAPTVHPSRDDYADEATLRRLYGYHCDAVDPGKKQEWYVVTRGLATGVYDSWFATSPLVTAVSGSVYHGVSSRGAEIRHYQISLACNEVMMLPESAKTSKYQG